MREAFSTPRSMPAAACCCATSPAGALALISSLNPAAGVVLRRRHDDAAHLQARRRGPALARACSPTRRAGARAGDLVSTAFSPSPPLSTAVAIPADVLRQRVDAPVATEGALWIRGSRRGQDAATANQSAVQRLDVSRAPTDTWFPSPVKECVMVQRLGLFLAAALLLAACASQPPVLQEVRFTQPATSSGS